MQVTTLAGKYAKCKKVGDSRPGNGGQSSHKNSMVGPAMVDCGGITRLCTEAMVMYYRHSNLCGYDIYIPHAVHMP